MSTTNTTVRTLATAGLLLALVGCGPQDDTTQRSSADTAAQAEVERSDRPRSRPRPGSERSAQRACGYSADLVQQMLHHQATLPPCVRRAIRAARPDRSDQPVTDAARRGLG